MYNTNMQHMYVFTHMQCTYVRVCLCSPCVATTRDESNSFCMYVCAIRGLLRVCGLQMCFWVEREVLDERNLKLRADTVGFFIRVAKVSSTSLHPPEELGGVEWALSVGWLLTDFNLF